MDNKKALEVAKPLFEKHKAADKLFVTTDRQVFFVENHAENHARSLDKKDPKVFPVERKELAAKPDKEAKQGDPAGSGSGNPDSGSTAAKGAKGAKGAKE